MNFISGPTPWGEFERGRAGVIVGGAIRGARAILTGVAEVAREGFCRLAAVCAAFSCGSFVPAETVFWGARVVLT